MSELTITGKTALCLVIGDPVAHSLSPSMHNAGYAALKLPFAMAATHVRSDNLAEAIRGIKALGIRGLAVTMPHKVSMLALLDSLDPAAKAIGAVNTVVNENGILKGYNTDWLGIARPLERSTSISGSNVAVLGAGGAAQAAVYACTLQGARTTIFNRDIDKARRLAERFGCEARPLTEANDLASYSTIINTTSVGMAPHEDASPLAANALLKHHTVFETIYHPAVTKLLRESQAAGAKIISGSEMFLEQGLAQFELHTGVKAPREEMRKILNRALGE